MIKTFSPQVLEQAIAHNLLIVSAEDSLRDVVRLINQGHNQDADQSRQFDESAKLLKSCVSCVLVVAESKLVGILTQSDLIRLMVMESDISKIKVADVMTQPVVTMQRAEFYDVDIPLKLLRQYRFSHLPLLNEHGYPIGLVTLKELLKVTDYTLQQGQIKQIEYELLLTTIANRIQSSLELQVTLDATVQEIRQFLKTDRVIVYRFEPDWSGVVVAESINSYCDSLLSQVLIDPHFGEAMVEPYKNGRIQVTDDIYVGLTDCHTKFLEQLQVKAIMVVPILQGDQLWGLLAAQECLQPRFWDRSSVALLQQLATHISIAIRQSNMMSDLQQLNQGLESKIEERTIELTNSENRLNLIVSNITEGILIADQEGQIVFANPSAGKMFGMPIDQLVGLSIGVPNLLNNQFEITYLAHDGKSGESEMQVVPIEWDQQPAYLISLHDITERLQSEAKLLKIQTLLTEAQQIAHVGSWQMDVTTQKITCSEEMYRLFRLEPQQEEQPVEYFAQYVFPQDRDILDHLMERAIQFGEPYELDLQMTRSDGSSGYYFVKGTPKRNAVGEVTHLFGTAMDISDRRLAEVQLQLTNEELSRATRLKDEFLANMSHELRTPLNSILGMTEAMQEQIFGSINDKQRNALQTVQRSSEHLLSLINDILDVAKIESGQIELDFAPTDIASLCQSSLAFIKQQAFKKSIQLEVKLPQNLPDQMLDERRIRQVLINLLNNAMKFTPEGGRIDLEVSMHQDQQALHPKDWLRFAIADTGIGIAAENINKLFQPFVQIDSALNRQYSGTGLGLALVKQMVELHGGRVSLTSELGVGSCFMIDLPYTASSSEPLPSLTTAALESPLASQDTQIYVILLVEDNEANIMTISGYLEAKGYHLLLAKNGEEAIASAKSHHPDLILMDIQMPVMDGLEATRQIRRDPDLVKTPIIALTALAMTGDQERCLAAGANEYLAKPVKLKQLAATIHQLLAT